MSKRTSGLGRGLGDLLADNSPEIRGGATVLRRDGQGEATITPDVTDGINGKDISEMRIFEGNNGISKPQDDTGAEEAAADAVVGPSEDAQVRVILGGSSQASEIDPYGVYSATGTTSAEAKATHRSLKALFKSYK